jgi:hypothetical protein
MAQRNKRFTPEAEAELVHWKPLGFDKAVSSRGTVLFILPSTRDKFLKEAKRKRRVGEETFDEIDAG